MELQKIHEEKTALSSHDRRTSDGVFSLNLDKRQGIESEKMPEVNSFKEQPNFVHLHVHSCYSILDGFSKVSDIAKKAKAMGQKAVALTDHGVMYGAVEFYCACKAEEIKPIIGCEVYVAPYGRTRFDRIHEKDSESRHLILLCKNEQGYKNLCYMVSNAFLEGFYYKPRVDMDLLRERHEGLIASSACLAGEVARDILASDYEGAKAYALEMQDIFGEGNFYLELQDHGIPKQKQVNAGISRLHEETGIPMICTNDSHYVEKEDWEAHDILLCLQTGKSLDDPTRMRYEPHNFYLRSTEEMVRLFSDYEGAIENTAKIADLCGFDFEFGTYHLPQFDVPEGYTAETYIRKLCEDGFRERYRGEHPEYHQQLDYELEMIGRMGFNEYFLIVSDFVCYAKSIGVPVGPGRGSAAGSIVSYCLHITDVEPMRYSLYFERFLNPERVSMPDIDMDFGDTRREEVVDYVRRKYGSDHVAQIVTFGTMAAKGAIRDVGRVLGMPYGDVDKVARAVPDELHMDLNKALETSPELRAMCENDKDVARLIELAKRMEGTPRNVSKHAAGVVITKDPVYCYVPLAKNEDSVVCQYNMVLLEELGLLKMDFLGLRNLTILDDAVKLAFGEDRGGFDINNIPLDDEEVFAMLGNGGTAGVFQLEASGMTDVCVKLKPQSIEDLTAVVALYRPGPMENIPRFIECKHDPSKIRYMHSLLEPILSNTYGVLVYQEQVIKTFQTLAGYSLGQADMVRRAMSKKKMKDIVRERETFLHGDPERNIPGCIKNGVPEAVGNEIYDEINAFANYAFNKAHAVCYAIISYQTAWMKCHYPQEYMASLLTSVMSDADRVTLYIGHCRDLGIKVLPPHVNSSCSGFTVENGTVRFGLSAISNIGIKIINSLVEERTKNGPFTDFGDFCERISRVGGNKRVVENLIRAGACSGLGANHRQMLSVYQKLLYNAQAEQKQMVEGQINMFDLGNEQRSEIVYPDVPEFDTKSLLDMEHSVTGIYMSGHPMSEFREDANASHAVPISQVTEDYMLGTSAVRYYAKQPVIVAGVISDMAKRYTKKGSMMATFTVEDETGRMRGVCFEPALSNYSYALNDGGIALLQGTISNRDENEPQIAVKQARVFTYNEAITDAEATAQTTATLWVRVPSISGPRMDFIRQVIEKVPGNNNIRVVAADTGKVFGGKCGGFKEVAALLRPVIGNENIVEK